MELKEALQDLPNQTWDMGTSQAGTTSILHIEDGKLVNEKWFDAEPLADDCHASRVASQGDNWGDGKVVGSMPEAQFNKMLREGTAFDQRAVMAWFKANPQFVRFERALK